MSEQLVGSAFTEKLVSLREEHKRIEQRRHSANAKLEESKKTLKRLQEEAVELFGTAEPKQLHELIQTRTKANQEALAAYEKALIEADKLVTALEAALNAEAPAEVTANA